MLRTESKPKRKRESPVRLYRFYNIEQSKYGEPFAMCDECREAYESPNYVYMRKVADRAVEGCQGQDHGKAGMLEPGCTITP